ncbi:hypothetical protein GX408_07615 [bacterium]|nr:hypothetical protein [bacterium]
MNAPQDRAGALRRYQEGSQHLEQIVLGLSEADLNAKPSRGGWTIRQIVHHIERIRAILREQGNA